MRSEKVLLRVPPGMDPQDVDLALVAEIIRSGELKAEIDAANNFDPDFEV